MRAERVRVVQNDEVLTRVDALMREAILIGPCHGANGDSQLVPLNSTGELDLAYSHDLLPPTRYLPPPSETLFRFQNGDGLRLTAEYDERRRIFFGIRSCDVKGIRYQEQLFRRDFPDIYFHKRFTNAALVSLACAAPPLATCFCPCCDGGPLLKPGEGTDIQLTCLKGRYLVEVDSEAGEALAAKAPGLFRDATSADLAEREDVLEGIDQKFSTSAYLSRGIAKMTTNTVPEEVWEELAERCVRCGGVRTSAHSAPASPSWIGAGMEKRENGSGVGTIASWLVSPGRPGPQPQGQEV